MPLTPGTRLGPYEILASLGAGGMGEVYRARDTRLGREVAVKVLPAAFAADPDRMRRFEQEARATGMLNHPNLLAVHDFGLHEASPYLVAELLQGATLREALPVPRRKALDYAGQIATGLAAAHAKGVIHRDLKPENVFITSDGRVKILDFGLAKLAGSELGPEDPTRTLDTAPYVALGTVGYMSPEQAVGKPADARSDIFSLGAVLYEMFSGQRAFRRASGIETLNAIVKEDPPPLADAGLERLVRRCLEKSPEQRFQSSSDLAFALANQADAQSGSGGQIATARSPGFRKWILPAAALILAGLAAGIFIGKGRTPNTAAAFRRLTYRRGTIYTARFTPDGQNIVYDAAWDGNPAELFATRRDTPEGRSLGLSQTTLLSLSSRGEMAVLTHSAYVHLSVNVGTLARAPLAGGAPREMTELVNEADWAPDGSRLLIVRRTGGKDVLEYPPGKVLVETGGWISHARFSPGGDRIAYLDHPVPGDDLGSVVMVDLAGKKTILSAGWSAVGGLAWSPDGREICFTAAHWGSARSLHAVTRSGKERLMLASPGGFMLYDISRGGDLLLGRQDSRYVALVAAPGDSQERNLSWLSATAPVDLSPDGRTVLLTEWGLGNGYAVGLRRTDGSPIVRLGDGNALALSRDGKFALTLSAAAPQYLTVVPTGAGDSRRLNVEGVSSYSREGASWFPDNKRILFTGAEPGHKMRTYWLDGAGGQPHPITPEGITGTSLSPDGRFVAAVGADDKDALYPVAGGDPVVVRGAKEGDLPVQWTADGRALFLQERGDWPKRVFRLDLATGRRELWKEIAPFDRAGLVPSNSRIRFTPDGNAYAYGARYVLSQLYLAEGLK